MKKDKSDFEYYTDSHSEPEVFSFSESENEKQFLNENFVFNAEENSSQTGLDINIDAAGKKRIMKLKKVKRLKKITLVEMITLVTFNLRQLVQQPLQQQHQEQQLQVLAA